MSVEHPWRLVYEITSGAPVPFFQGFVHVVPHPGGCRLIRSFLAEPGPDGSSAEFLATAETILDRWVDDLVTGYLAAPHPEGPPGR